MKILRHNECHTDTEDSFQQHRHQGEEKRVAESGPEVISKRTGWAAHRSVASGTRLGEPVTVVAEAHKATRIEETILLVKHRIRFEGKDNTAYQRVKNNDADKNKGRRQKERYFAAVGRGACAVSRSLVFCHLDRTRHIFRGLDNCFTPGKRRINIILNSLRDSRIERTYRARPPHSPTKF